VLPILLAVSAGHFLNDTMQSALLSIYPLIKEPLALDFVHIGIITLVFQLTASILQPIIGLYTDRHPQPFSLPFGMASTFVGMLLLSVAGGFATMLLAAALIGIGSSVFHPEASRVARLASGGRYGFAQSVFQVGGNAGQAISPLLVALLVIPNGQLYIAWFALAAVIGTVILSRVGLWYRDHLALRRSSGALAAPLPVGRNRVIVAIAILLALTFSKNFYAAAFASYYTFFLIERFAVSVGSAQIHLFLFLGAVAVGTLIGGPIGDRIGRKPILWISILGVLPLSLALPFVSLFWTDVLAVLIGLTMASAFPAIIVYAQQLLPGRVGMIGGLFFGFAFGMGGIGAALIGWLADARGIEWAFQLCALLPAIGLLVVFLPDLDQKRS
jgi:MFS transporter, FSR family, fosmidomycin resistance protein